MYSRQNTPRTALSELVTLTASMTRLSSYRDFDWVLLGFVLLLSLISVLEIKSATLHTKFRGFDHKQIEFLRLD